MIVYLIVPVLPSRISLMYALQVLFATFSVTV